MGSTVPSIEATLNLMWGLVSLAVLLCWQAEWTRESKRALVAILCILVLLFPVISAADDLVRQAAMYDPSSSPLTVNGDSDGKASIAPAMLSQEPGHGLGRPLLVVIGEEVRCESLSGRTGLLVSASGIHSPPQF